jgi:hypothetical protein
VNNDQKLLFDACMKQAEYFAGRWDERRTYEWKTTVAVWALTVGGIYFVKRPELVPKWTIILLVASYAFLWLKRVWEANDVDKQQMNFYQAQAYAAMKDPAYTVGTPPPFTGRPIYNVDFLKNWSMQFQLLSVALLAYLFYAVPRST